MLNNYYEFFHTNPNELPEERDAKEHDFKKLFGENFAKYLEHTDTSMEKLSSLTGYDKQHFYGIRSGKKAPSLFCLFRMCTALNVTPDYLWNYESSLNEPDDLIEAKTNLLLNKLSSIKNEALLDKLISEIDFFNNISRKSDDIDY